MAETPRPEQDATPTPEQSEAPNPAEPLFSCSFQISGRLPKIVYQKFVELQANMLGLRGWIEEVAEDQYRGYFEGERPKMEKLKERIEQAEKFAANIQQVAFAEYQRIEKYTMDNFKSR